MNFMKKLTEIFKFKDSNEDRLKAVLLTERKEVYDQIDPEMIKILEKKPLFMTFPRNEFRIIFNQLGFTNLIIWLREEGYEIRKIEK